METIDIDKFGEIQPVLYEIEKNEKSNHLYIDVEPFSKIVYVYIEKNSGYFETNSNFLAYDFCLIRGVNQKEYDNNSTQLLNLISMMYCHDLEELEALEL
ncbi:hypothetical protein M2140_000192 [Clostridiales Family XIII bacterium PM5-7]